jgi:two-component system, OmpR family, alkaline phosphatase synthesis response regulator PhoP
MKKLLLVDDEKNIRNLLRECFKDQGYEIDEAEDGVEALEKARKFKPDLIILDIMMPDKWGYEVCEELKADPETKDILVMFLSARVSLPSQKMGEQKGGDFYMVKPFKPSELVEKVNEILK